MLYVFFVNTGTMLHLDMNLAVNTVENLKQNIANQFRIPVEKQVLLISGGESLNPKALVCSYSAGTDTNPIYLFSKTTLEGDVNPPVPTTEFGTDDDLAKQVDAAINLPPTYATVVARANLAMALYEQGNLNFKDCEKCVHQQHLQQQGWAAVVANLEDTTQAYGGRIAKFYEYGQAYLQTRPEHLQLLQHYSQDLTLLSRIPVLPALLNDLGDSSSTDFLLDPNHTLLHWISSTDNQSSLEQVADTCCRGLQQFDAQMLETLRAEAVAVLEQAGNVQMKEIKGLESRLCGLEQLMFDSKARVQEQKDQAAALQLNQVRASTLCDPSILPDLCSSHKKQLHVMLKTHDSLCDKLRRCVLAKDELSVNLHARLRWIEFVERSMCEENSKMMIYHENLKRLNVHLDVLKQIHLAPRLYLSAVAEVVRRKSYSKSFLEWSTCLSQQSLELHTREVSVRKAFYSQLSSHFLKALFRGMEDYPPPFATQTPLPFDVNLPPVTEIDLERLQRLLPDLANYFECPEVTGMPRIDSPLTPDGRRRIIGELSASAPPTVSGISMETRRTKSEEDTGLGSSGGTMTPSEVDGFGKDVGMKVGSTRSVIPEEKEDEDVGREESEAETDEFEKVENILNDVIVTRTRTSDHIAGFAIPEDFDDDDDDDRGISEAKQRRVEVMTLEDRPMEETEPATKQSDDQLTEQQNRLQVMEGILQSVHQLEKKEMCKLQTDIATLRKEVTYHRDDLKRYIVHAWASFVEALAGVSRNVAEEQKEAVQSVIKVREEHATVLEEFRNKLEQESAEVMEARKTADDYHQQLKNTSARLEALENRCETQIDEMRTQQKELVQKMILEHELELDNSKEEYRIAIEAKESEMREIVEEKNELESQLTSLRVDMNEVQEKLTQKFQVEKDEIVSYLNEEKMEAVAEAVMQEKNKMETEIQRLQTELDEAAVSFETKLEQRLDEQRQSMEAEWHQRINSANDEWQRSEKEISQQFENRLRVLQEEMATREEKFKLEREEMLREARSSWDVEKELELAAIKNELETLRLRTVSRLPMSPVSPLTASKLAVSPDTPSTTSTLEGLALLGLDLEEQPEVLATPEFPLPPDEGTAKVIDGLQTRHKEELDRLRREYEEKLNAMRASIMAEKQVVFNKAVNKVVEEKERVIEEQRQREGAFLKQQEADRVLMQKLATENTVLLDAESRLQKYQELDRINRLEIERLELELVNVHKKFEQMDQGNEFQMSVMSEAAAGLTTSVIPVESHERILELESSLRFREEEMSKLQTKLVELSMTSSAATLLQQDKVSILSCNVGDLVLLCYNEKHDNYLAFLVCPVYHFLHSDCLEVLGLKPVSGESRKSWVLAEITDKEYCQAKKAQNRFRVPLGTKFYRVRAKPWDKDPTPFVRDGQRSRSVSGGSTCGSASVYASAPASPTASH